MKYFGTDGIRDRVTGSLLEQDFVYRLGQAVGQWIKRNDPKQTRHVIIGRDTRTSGGSLFLTISRGLKQEGIRIFDAGVCPTPATAVAMRIMDLDLGIVITASHNPASDNGIKLFGPGGCKLTAADEEEIEALLDSIPAGKMDVLKTPPVRYFEARRHYIENYKDLMQSKALVGMKIALDCANGSTCRTTPELLESFGATLFKTGCSPDGNNINQGVGSEHPEVMAKVVIENKADMGISHDGDGDRVILCDHKGNVVDGDAVLAILGKGWSSQNRLAKNTLVATIMSNLGLDRCLQEAGVTVERVGVGDRQVFYCMRDNGYVLGGESSGHFIAMDYLPTGDGLLAAILVINEMIRTGKSLAELSAIFQPFPQIKSNLPVSEKKPLEQQSGLQSDLDALTRELGNRGRILLRYSGTEPKIRLLAEAEDASLAQSSFDKLSAIVHEHLPVQA